LLKPLRRLYDWVLHWAETPYGPLALFILSFCESSFFPVPPDALLIALCLGMRNRSFRFAVYCTIASVLGALLGYTIGHFLWYTPSGELTAIAGFFFDHIPGFTHEAFANIEVQYKKWDFWIVFTAGFTPIPYKLFTVTSGIFSINILMFIIASVVSRGARFFLVAYLIWRFGGKIRTFIDKYFNILALVFTVLLIAGFVVVKYLI
jgi:membrane protein YqaA with SNARE-associated domain